ncbi:unnamed protein product [Rangifer tarandus platyrhynchus]|uniref:Uncharacterized protein n=2 Tax=Rangifer tarandus platyrhynchus TaxID=3082113 RepID=A0AC59YKR2_RANTA|nr:unnamed protein product [Rangifer tarandus platyrhynchus]
MKEVKVKVAQCVRLSATPWTTQCMEFSRPEYWSERKKKKKKNTGVGNLFPSPGDLPNPGIKPRSPALQVDSLPAELSGKPTLCITFLKGIKRDFPGGPLLKTLCSQYRGPGFKP